MSGNLSANSYQENKKGLGKKACEKSFERRKRKKATI